MGRGYRLHVVVGPHDCNFLTSDYSTNPHTPYLEAKDGVKLILLLERSFCLEEIRISWSAYTESGRSIVVIENHIKIVVGDVFSRSRRAIIVAPRKRAWHECVLNFDSDETSLRRRKL